MNSMSSPFSLRRVRAAVVGLFFLAGLTFAMWVVNIPAIQAETGISHGVLGGLLLLLGLGSFVGMQAAGPVVDRFGSRQVAVVGAALLVVGVNLPGLAGSAWQLGAALLVLGLGTGAIDVAMNDQAVLVERAYGRPIMSSFHAYFSVGGGAGALVGAATQALGLPVQWSLAIGAIIAAALALLCIPLTLVPGSVAAPADDTSGTAPEVVNSKRVWGKVALLAALAFLMMLSEGTANDWSALHAVDHLDQPSSAASLAFGAFAVAMTVGRFTADPVARRFGAVNVVRFGSVVAAVGMLCVVASPLYPLTLVGWAVFGVGLSGIVPQIFTAAGNLGVANQGVVISRVVGAGYLGLLAGPAVIGWASEWIGLHAALALPIVCCIAGVALAGRVAPANPGALQQPAMLAHVAD